MKPYILIAAICGLAGCGGTSIPIPSVAGNSLLSSEPASSTINVAPNAPEADADFASLLNNMRLDNGAGLVSHDSLLDQAAQDYAVLLLETNHFDHVGPDGSTMVERVNATGYEWSALGENLGTGQQNEQQIMDGWTGSPGHHANNINPVFTEFGLGFVRDGTDTRWVLVLGTPR